MSQQAVKGEHYLVPIKVYLGVALALFILTVVTVAVSKINLGGWNVVVALAIAGVKGLMVLLIFMHLLYDKKLYLIVFVIAILFLSIFIIFTMFDTMTRDQIYPEVGRPINESSSMYDSLSVTIHDSIIENAGDSAIVDDDDDLNDNH
ncbi:MAG: cytochrome C oxidase subunit IV family protein [Candidatus Zixiibacteriota bacterium]